MEEVALHLQQEAIRRETAESDSFGRSAFNRYYYATFLDVKNGLGSLRPEWGNIPHKSVPEILRASVKREIGRGRDKAQRNSDAATVALCSRAIAAASELANLMEVGYAIRVAADYHPEIKVDFSERTDFQLNTVRVKAASDWPIRARSLIRIVVSAWKQINV